MTDPTRPTNLTTGTCRPSGAPSPRPAAATRSVLSRERPGTPFTVDTLPTGAVRVTWSDGPAVTTIAALLADTVGKTWPGAPQLKRRHSNTLLVVEQIRAQAGGTADVGAIDADSVTATEDATARLVLAMAAVHTSRRAFWQAVDELLTSHTDTLTSVLT